MNLAMPLSVFLVLSEVEGRWMIVQFYVFPFASA
jgi:hypothetical protein